jgi:hypothetical protein
MPDRAFDEAHLRSLASRAAYPPTPELRPRVLAALATEAGATRVGQPTPAVRPARLAWVAAAAVVCAAALAFAVSSSRDAIAEFFGIEGSRIDILPTPPPGVTPTPFPPEAPLEQIGTRLSLEEAERLAGFALSLPSGEPPEDVFVVRYGDETVAVLRYPQFDLWQARLEPSAYFDKGAPSGVRVEDTLVDGHPATWVTGGTHFVRYVDATGAPVEASLRTVERSTLIWNDGATFFRVETGLSLVDARAVAESLR